MRTFGIRVPSICSYQTIPQYFMPDEQRRQLEYLQAWAASDDAVNRLNRNEALRNMGIHSDQLRSRLGGDSAMQVGLDDDLHRSP